MRLKSVTQSPLSLVVGVACWEGGETRSMYSTGGRGTVTAPARGLRNEGQQ